MSEETQNDLGAPELPPVEGQALTGEVLNAPAQDNGDPAVAGMIAGLSLMVFGLLADRRGDHWRLSEGEAQEFGGASAAVIAKYFPDAQASPEMRLLLVAGAILGVRVMVDVSKRKQAESNQATVDAKAD